jgi:hypothetical protein
MKNVQIFFFVFLSTVYWFLCGGPNFVDNPASLGYFALGLAYISCMIWTDALFNFFKGDRYTYGAAVKGIALAFGSPAVIVIALLVRVDSNLINIPTWLNNVGIGFTLLGFLPILSVPMMSTNTVDSLPSQQSRREYDDKSTVSTPQD